MSLKAFETIRRYGMLEGCRGVVAAVSGGADSTALLHLLCTIREETGIAVYAAHVNHGLRGEESRRDEEFIRKTCAQWDVPFFLLRADVAAQARKTGESVEEAGRRVRYGFLKKLAAEKAAKIATAHTLSDSIETALINFIRGTGLKGLCGIPPVRGAIIRPLINDARADIERYCADYGIAFVQDSTNFSRDYTRNRIRLDVIPVLYRINASFGRSAGRSMDNLRADERFLSELATIKLNETKCAGGGYDASKLAELESPVLCRAVAKAAQECTKTAQESVHIEKIAGIVRKGCGRVSVRGGFYAVVRGHRLTFEPSVLPQKGPDVFSFPLRNGVYANRYFQIHISTIENFENNFQKINKVGFKNLIDCDKIKGNVTVRNRISGDSFRPAGRNVTKTLKKLFNEQGIPLYLRSSIPCVADENGILWVYGFGPDERCRAGRETRRAIRIDIKNLEGQ